MIATQRMYRVHPLMLPVSVRERVVIDALAISSAQDEAAPKANSKETVITDAAQARQYLKAALK